MTRHFSRLALTLLVLAPLGAQNDLRDTGPLSLVIQYRCYPGHRNQLRQAMADRGLAQFEDWKTRGILADYQILFSRYVDTGSWDMLALLSFRKFDDVARWRVVERRSPAGLPADAADWMSAIASYPVDLVRQKPAQPVPDHPVYLVVPYTLSLPAHSYLEFVDGYERPQLDGWAQEGILSGYGFFLQRYTAARSWDSLLVLEFKDDASLGARDSIAAKVHRALESSESWRQLAGTERNMRIEQAATIADDLGRDR